MIFIDRFTGGKISELPTALLPGRYCLLGPLEFNGHSQLRRDNLLLDDGSGVVRIDGEEHRFAELELSDKDEADTGLSAEAIVNIAGKITAAPQGKVSPMLPPEMAAQCELDEIEKSLADVLGKGHLHSISDRPRMDLRYDDSVTPVARARRLATSALSHLASHTDCWQQRTLSGVQPRKILARFSEDDYAIYENRLFKCLLERLDRHLARRLARIGSVNNRLEQALEFEGSGTHWRLRKEICTLWGESFQGNETGESFDAGKRAVEQLESLLRSVRGLKQRGLFTLLPTSSLVPEQVHRTNILNHDPHYRHLPPLWEKLQKEPDDRQLTPQERLVKYQQLQLAYSSYVGLVLRRALDRYALNQDGTHFNFSWAGRKFTVKQDGHDWLIEDSKEGLLRFVPIAWFGTSIADDERLDSACVVCWPGNSDSKVSSQRLPISPLDLYVVEKMGRLIDEWMLRPVVKAYGGKIGPLPTPVMQLIGGWNEFENVTDTHVRLLAPLDEEKVEQIKAELRSFANLDVQNKVAAAIEHVGALARLCGHFAQFRLEKHGFPEKYGFYGQCSEPGCLKTWSLKTSEGKTVFALRRNDRLPGLSSDKGFIYSGRDWLNFDL